MIALCIAIVCIAVIVCHWLTLKSEEARGRMAQRCADNDEDRVAWNAKLALLQAEVRELAPEVKQLRVLENKRQMGGRG